MTAFTKLSLPETPPSRGFGYSWLNPDLFWHHVKKNTYTEHPFQIKMGGQKKLYMRICWRKLFDAQQLSTSTLLAMLSIEQVHLQIRAQFGLVHANVRIFFFFLSSTREKNLRSQKKRRSFWKTPSSVRVFRKLCFTVCVYTGILPFLFKVISFLFTWLYLLQRHSGQF